MCFLLFLKASANAIPCCNLNFIVFLNEIQNLRSWNYIRGLFESWRKGGKIGASYNFRYMIAMREASDHTHTDTKNADFRMFDLYFVTTGGIPPKPLQANVCWIIAVYMWFERTASIWKFMPKFAHAWRQNVGGTGCSRWENVVCVKNSIPIISYCGPFLVR